MSEIALQSQPPGQVSRAAKVVGKIYNNFLLRSLARRLFTAWIVITIIFFVIRLMPGSPIDVLVQDLVINRGYSFEEAQQQAASLTGINLREPLLNQYWSFLVNLTHGDLGKSYRSQGVTVNSIIAQRLPWTLFSVGISLALSFFIGILLGMLVAYRRNSWIDHLLTNLAAIMDAIPAYLTALMLFLLLGVIWKVVPIAYMRGSHSPGVPAGFNLRYIADIFAHLGVPALAYILGTAGSWMLTMKSSTVSTLGEDYVTVARARGLPDSRIMTAYVGRNASLPLATRLAISVAVVMGGSLIIESIFTYQGIGWQLAQALYQRDYPVMQGIFIITTIAVIFANFLADLLYGFLDPRARITGGN
jgi:peptide/nickel transport system permease protein